MITVASSPAGLGYRRDELKYRLNSPAFFKTGQLAWLPGIKPRPATANCWHCFRKYTHTACTTWLTCCFDYSSSRLLFGRGCNACTCGVSVCVPSHEHQPAAQAFVRTSDVRLQLNEPPLLQRCSCCVKCPAVQHITNLGQPTAQAASSALTTSCWSFSCATSSAVLPSMFFASRLAPASSSIFTASACPYPAA